MTGRAALLAIPLALALAAPGTAGAVYQCGNQKDDCQCGMADPYPCCSNGGNCTWWAWEAACCNWRVGLPGWGNANQWAGNARAHPNYDVISFPVVGSIACRVSGTYGHVAWVTRVDGGNITVTEENCCGTCNYGLRTWNYNASYFDGGFIVRNGQVECRPGECQEQGCGRCGRQRRCCGPDGRWGGWSGCGGEGPCSPGQSESQGCGRCGRQSRSCGGNCQWNGWSGCEGEGPCNPNQTETQACGFCGQQSRTCGGNCQWPEWPACNGGECKPESVDRQPCGDCGEHSRVCSADCKWGEFGSCSGPDPAGGTALCDTSLAGACRDGIQRCVEGKVFCEQSVQPSEESCDGIDNDCDGATDNAEACRDASGGAGESASAVARCGCAQGASGLSLLGLAALGVLLRRGRARR